MSVILFTTEELARTYRQYEFVQPYNQFAPTTEEMGLILQVVHYANLMAYCLTYEDARTDADVRICDLDQAITKMPRAEALPGGDLRVTQTIVVRQLRHLLYNTGSNGGTHCMPSPYRERLEFAAQCIADSLAGL
jgi:hypothetical protein